MSLGLFKFRSKIRSLLSALCQVLKNTQVLLCLIHPGGLLRGRFAKFLMTPASVPIILHASCRRLIISFPQMSVFEIITTLRHIIDTLLGTDKNSAYITSLKTWHVISRYLFHQTIGISKLVISPRSVAPIILGVNFFIYAYS